MESATKVVPIDINKEMHRSFLAYSMSVIVSRALPDIRDGLKPVHRRILYALHELGMLPDKPHRKSANLVGEVLGKYHPHGDSAVYDAMVRLAQDFSTRYPLVDGHGNFGSVDGDSAAAMRYTEVRLAKIALEMLADIDKETVDFRLNYDESREEPTVLPSRIPNILINGSSGIAVGMATNIPPHNLGEVVDSLVHLIAHPEADSTELMNFVQGPDFPTGGIIMGTEGIKSAYTTGRGSIRVRARTDFEQLAHGNKTAIIITELPYQVNKARLVEKIAELVREKRIEGITDLRDESDRSGMRVVIELHRDAVPRVVLNHLFKLTQMEDTFGVIMLALVEGKPQVLDLRQVLGHFLDHRKEVITRRTQFELRKAEERLHIVEGLRIALDHIDEVIQTIRESSSTDVARKALMEKFGLSNIQAQAILEMRFRQLTGLEREKLEEEYRDLLKLIGELKGILADEQKILAIIRKELLEAKKKFGDDRRSQISQEVDKIDIEDLIPNEEVVLTITHQGYIKRLPLSTYRSQKRGGRGVTGLTTKTEDFVEHLFITTTHHYLLFFTNNGQVYRLKVYEIPEGGRQAKGTSAVNLLNLAAGEGISAVIPVQEFAEDQYLLMGTIRGIMKKTQLSQYRNTRRDGIIAIQLDPGDELVGVKLTDGQEEVMLSTRSGLSIRFKETEVRHVGRVARGVKGINLKLDDVVVSMDTIRDDAQVLAVTEKGFGKRTPAEQYRTQKRGGSGIKALKLAQRNGPLAAIKLVHPEDELMLISHEGIIIRIKVEQISEQRRDAQGVTLMKLDRGDKVVAVAKVVNRDVDEEE